MSVQTLDYDDFAKYLDETNHIAKLHSADSYKEDVLDRFYKPIALTGDSMPFHSMEHKFRFRPGEVTIWAGYNGHGKSLLLGQVMMHMIAHHQKRICLASMEMKPMTTLARMARQYFGSALPSREELCEYFDIIGPYCWLYDHQGVVVSKELVAAMKYAAKDLKVDHFVVDSLMKCGINEDDFNRQKSFVDELCSIGRDTNMHIHLVCHSRKGQDEARVPGKMDIRGSGTITDQVDNVITVWRNKDMNRPEGEDALVIVDKQRNGEWEGQLPLRFMPDGQSFEETFRGRAPF